jgi:hypothetical protein
MIIGLTGLARSGKNEVSKVLHDKFKFDEFSFAEPIRNFVIDFLKLRGLDELDEIKEIPNALFGGKTPRYVMQTLGTEWGRESIYDSIWVDRCIYLAEKSENAVIFDVRFENEARVIKERGGMIVNIIRPSIQKSEIYNHISESGIDREYIDYWILNDSSLENLKESVIKMVEHLSQRVS